MVELTGKFFRNKKNKQISIAVSKKLITKEDKKDLENLFKGKKVKLRIL